MSKEATEAVDLATLARMAAAEDQGAAAVEGPTTSEIAAMEAATGGAPAEPSQPSQSSQPIGFVGSAPPPADMPADVLGTEAEEAEADATAALQPLLAGEDDDSPYLQAEEAAPPTPPSESEVIDVDPFGIGNDISILSKQYGYKRGIIIYRDDKLIRLLPQDSSSRPLEYPLINGGTEFLPGLGVTEVSVKTIGGYTHYVDFLHVEPGNHVEFFTATGAKARDDGDVAEVLKSEKKDAIRLTDGTVLKFAGRGPAPPIAVIRVVSEAARPAAAAEVAVELEQEAAPVAAEADILELLRAAGRGAVEEARGDQGFPDSMQREDLFQDLIDKLTPKQRSNPRRVRPIEREVDLALSLKNSVTERTAAGNVVGAENTVVNTLADVLRVNKKPLPALIPIVDAALVLNLDTVEPTLAYNPTDVSPRILCDIETASETSTIKYLEDRSGMSFAGYIHELTSENGVTLVGRTPMNWSEDQDVIRTAGFDTRVQSLNIDMGTYKPEESVISLAQLASNTNDRNIRVLTPDYIHLHKFGRGDIIAKSDPSKISGFATLPTKAALSLRPPKRPGDLPTALLYSAALQDENLPTVAQALVNLHATEPSPLNSYTVDADNAASTDLATWLSSVLKYAVHPVDSLGPRGPRLLAVLDSIGLGDSDMSPEVSNVIWSWARRSQRMWINLLNEERRRVAALRDAEPARTYQTVTGDDSPVWPLLQETATLKDILDDITAANPAIAEAPTVITAGLLKDAQGDALPLVWSALARFDGREIGLDDIASSASLNASRAAALRRKALRDFAILQLSAQPEINPCPHVRTLEAIRNMPDLLERSRLLRDFIEEYQGGRNGEWVTCVLCQQDCVCYHEIMDLEALAQPARMEAIHREMLVRFGGERYEGKVVCKNCGQALEDIELDDREEFDDDGNVIKSRSVLTEEQMEESVTDMVWKKTTDVVTARTIRWATDEQGYLYGIMLVIASRGSLQIPDETMQKIIQRAETYVNIRKPTQTREVYEKTRTTLEAVKKAGQPLPPAFKGKALPPPYDEYVNQIRVGALMGLTVVALQSADPPILVNNPYHICPFSREGYPLEEGADPTDTERPSAVLYIACVVASIVRPTAPWNTLRWQVETKVPSRQKDVQKLINEVLTVIIGTNPKISPLPFTAEVRHELDAMRSDTTAKAKREMVSAKDQLPAGFKPEPSPPSMSRPAVEGNPLKGVVDALTAEADIAPLVDDIATALTRQAIAVVDELHAAAKAGITAPTKVTNSVCCPVSFARAAAGELLGEPEQANLVAAGTLLRRAIPTVPTAGSHLRIDHTIPIPEPVDQEVDQGVLFKLFLKYCYTGPQIGRAHEFSTGDMCRQCGLRLGKSLDLIDFGTEGAAILAAQGGDLKRDAISFADFDALSNAVRQQKRIVPRPLAGKVPWQEGLELLIATAKKRTDLAEGEGVKAPAAAILSVLGAIGEAATTDYDDEARAVLWGPMDGLLRTLRDEVLARIGPVPAPRGSGKAGETRAKEAIDAMTMFDQLTQDPFVEGPRAVQEYWCAKAEAVGDELGIPEIRLAKWARISREHDERIARILTENTHWYGGSLVAEARPVLRRFSRALGPFMRAWQHAVRPDSSENSPWSVDVARIVLRCIVMQLWRDAVSEDSWMYRPLSDVADEAVRARFMTNKSYTAVSVGDWTRGLMKHAKQQFVRYSKDRIRQILQQRRELERTTIVEEFTALDDDDLRRAFIMTKNLKIGRWARGANIRTLDADQFEFEQQQLVKMGITDPNVELVMVESTAQQMGEEAEEDGYDLGDANADD
jgi:hypothetical protein